VAIHPRASSSRTRSRSAHSLKARIASGKPVFGCIVGIGHPTPVEILGHAGFDFVEIDFERGAIDLSQAEAMTVAARLSGVSPIWRMRSIDHVAIGTALDLGAEGVLVPHVTTAAMAADVVSAALYPPAGNRGLAPRRPVRFGVDDVERYFREANKTTVVSIMVEDREAVDAIDEIAAVAGLDLLVIGTWDLSRSLGVPIKPRHRKVLRAIDKIVKAAKANDLALSIPPESPKDAARWFNRGITVFESATLDGLLLSSAAASVQALSEAVRPTRPHDRGRR